MGNPGELSYEEGLKHLNHISKNLWRGDSAPTCISTGPIFGWCMKVNWGQGWFTQGCKVPWFWYSFTGSVSPLTPVRQHQENTSVLWMVQWDARGMMPCAHGYTGSFWQSWGTNPDPPKLHRDVITPKCCTGRWEGIPETPTHQIRKMGIASRKIPRGKTSPCFWIACSYPCLHTTAFFFSTTIFSQQHNYKLCSCSSLNGSCWGTQRIVLLWHENFVYGCSKIQEAMPPTVFIFAPSDRLADLTHFSYSRHGYFLSGRVRFHNNVLLFILFSCTMTVTVARTWKIAWRSWYWHCSVILGVSKSPVRVELY